MSENKAMAFTPYSNAKLKMTEGYIDDERGGTKKDFAEWRSNGSGYCGYEHWRGKALTVIERGDKEMSLCEWVEGT